MTGEEYAHWAALWAIDPWGPSRADLRAGIIAATIANYAGKQRATGAASATPAEFMPYHERQDTERDPDPMEFFMALS